MPTETSSQIIAAGLYIVATPIGNLRDITIRALDILKAADLIACEDTRVSGKLLSYYGINSKTTSYNEHNSDNKKLEFIISQLLEGKKVALISDAGTPLISDPGYRLVREAARLGINIIPIPGASSAISALSVSGLATDRFMFLGFLPAKSSAREKAIKEIATIKATLIIFESVHRLNDSLAHLAEYLGEREAVVAREITKLHEEIKRGTLNELALYFKQKQSLKGEFVILISPNTENEESEIDIDALLIENLKKMSLKDAVSMVAKISGVAKNEVYDRALKIKEGIAL